MNVPVKINQKVNGLNYDGTIQVGERTFNWELNFGAPADKILSQEVKAKDAAAVRKLFGVTLKFGDKQFEITDELFGFLVGTVVTLALDFYQEPQTQDFNAGSIQHYVRQLSDLGAAGANASCGMETAYNIPEERIPKVLMEQNPVQSV